VRTEVAADGTVAREIEHVFPKKQPAEGEEPPPEGFEEPDVPAALLLPDRGLWPGWEPSGRRLVVRGAFSSVEELPPIFQWLPRSGAGPLDTEASLESEDFVFFERLRWTERFRPPVDRDEMERSVTAAIDASVAILQDALRATLGEQFELRDLDAWIGGDCRRMLRELVLVWWEELREVDENRLTARVAERLSRGGVELGPADLEGAEALERIRSAFARRVAALVQPRGAKRGSKPPPLVERLAAVEERLGPEALPAALEEAAARRFGSVEAAGEWLERRSQDLVGGFGGPDSKDLIFDVTVRLPGDRLRSNGYVLDDGACLWRFRSGDLFPHGKSLEVESLLHHHDVLGKTSDGKGYLDRRDVIDLIGLLGDERGAPDPNRVEAIRRGLERVRPLDETLAPLRDLDADVADGVRRVLARPGA
jgi:hypothetical protein